MIETPRIAVLTSKPYAECESFVRAHLQRLAPELLHIHGRPLPLYYGDDHLFAPLGHRWVNALLSRLTGYAPAQMDRLLIERMPRSWACRYLARLLVKKNIDVVLAEFGPSAVKALGGCQRAGVPLVAHFHGMGVFNQNVLKQYCDRYLHLFSYCSRVISVSRDMSEKLVQLGAPREKIVYNPCGADVQQFSAGDPAKAGPVFIAASRLVAIKAPYLLLLAFRKVLDREPAARLAVLGDGEMMDACLQITKALGLVHAVDFRGSVSNEEVALAMREARAFVQHSMRTRLTEMEGGLSVSLLEAGASGLPAVVSRCGGMKEAVEHGETGFLVEEGDVDAMARHMLFLAQNPDKAAEMGRKAREMVLKDFSMDLSLEKLRHVLSDVVESNRRVRCS